MTRLHLAPSHLLSELDAFAILLSFAKTTCYTLTIFLSFQNWAPPQSAYWLGYRKTIISSPPPSIWQYLVSVHPSMSASRLKIEWSTPSRCISLLPEATPFNPTIMFGTTLEKMVFLWSAFWAPLEHVDKHVLTFTAYVFTAYSIDEKPAISSFKELICWNILFSSFNIAKIQKLILNSKLINVFC